MERIGFVGLGTMGAAMAANLRRAGFEVTVWNRTPGRAADLVALGAVRGRHAGRCRPGRGRRGDLRLGHARCRRRAVRPRRRRRRPGRRRPRHRLLHDLAGGDRRVCRAPPGARRGVRGRAGLGRVGGCEERHADDLRRRRARRRGARPPGPRGDGQDDHPLRPCWKRPGGQGRQPGRDRRHLPRRGRGHDPRDEGRAGSRRWSRGRSVAAWPRAGSSRTGAGR